jgi:hypothetical protein
MIQRKTNILNKSYKQFQKNVLFLETSIAFGVLDGSNPFLMCDVDVCNVGECKRSDDCNNCARKALWDTDEFKGCNENDCKTHKICAVGEIVRALKETNFTEKLKFNPIILSRNLGDEKFCWFVINTDDFTVCRYEGSRNINDVEKAKKKFGGKKDIARSKDAS